MTKAKEQKEFTPVSFDEIVYDLPAVLYDADAAQDVSFYDERRTPDGHIEVLAAHTLAPLSDELLFQREREYVEQSKNKSALSTKPTEKLWREMAQSRIGYKERADWKDKVKGVDQLNVISALMHLAPIEDEAVLSDEYLIDDEDLACLKFRAYFGGFTVDEWKEWFQTGHFPENVVLTEESYASALAKLQKGIKPNVLLVVAFNFKEATKKQIDEAFSLLFDLANPNKLASAARDEKTYADRWFALYKEVLDSFEGYKGRVPAFHAIAAARAYFTQEAGRLGKSLTD
jgi:hypothetical protein